MQHSSESARTNPVRTPLLVASDVDGTLIDDDDRISPRTRAAVRSIVDSGVPFVLCTGRPPRWIWPVVDELGFAPPAVCANGAVLYDSESDRILTARTISAPTLSWIADLAREALPGCGLAAERIGEKAHDAVTPQFVASPGYTHAWLNPQHTVMSERDVLGEPAIKLLIRQPSMSSAAMVAVLGPLIGDKADITFSTDSGLIEIAAHGITKATGLAEIAARFAVQPESIVAFGDMPNDVPMLEWVGHGVAVGNAHADALRVADEVTATNREDGVALVLERWWR